MAGSTAGNSPPPAPSQVDAWCFRRWWQNSFQCVDATWEQIGHFKVGTACMRGWLPVNLADSGAGASKMAARPRRQGPVCGHALTLPRTHRPAPQYHLKQCIQAAVIKGFTSIYVLPHNDIKGAQAVPWLRWSQSRRHVKRRSLPGFPMAGACT
jgi:hypothetical protein